MKQYLRAKKIPYRQLNRKIFAIADNKNWLENIKISHNPFNYLRFQSGLGQYHELTLATKSPKNLASETAKLIYLLNFAQQQKINGIVSPAGIIFKIARLNDLFGRPQFPDSATLDCDLFVNIPKIQNNPLSEFNLNKLLGHGGELFDLLNSQPLTACLKKTGNGNNLLTDYDVNINVGVQTDNSARQKIERGLIILASRLSPSARSVYLNDGTRVVELYPNIHNFEISKTADASIIDLHNGRQLIYQLSNQGLNLSNNANQANLPAPTKDNYLLAKINNLPNTSIKKYLNDFSYLIANNNVLVIK